MSGSPSFNDYSVIIVSRTAKKIVESVNFSPSATVVVDQADKIGHALDRAGLGVHDIQIPPIPNVEKVIIDFWTRAMTQKLIVEAIERHDATGSIHEDVLYLHSGSLEAHMPINIQSVRFLTKVLNRVDYADFWETYGDKTSWDEKSQECLQRLN